jgi:hypothetical protein
MTRIKCGGREEVAMLFRVSFVERGEERLKRIEVN